MFIDVTSAIYDLQHLGPFLAVSALVLFFLLQLQKPFYCKLWHKKYWVFTKVTDFFEDRQEIVCKKCGHHFMK